MIIVDWETFQLVDYVTINQITDFVGPLFCRSSICDATISHENSWGLLRDIPVSGCRRDYLVWLLLLWRCRRHLGAGNSPDCLGRRYFKMTMSVPSPSQEMQLVKLHRDNLNFWTSSPSFSCKFACDFSMFTKYGCNKILVLRNLNLSEFPQLYFLYTVSLRS